VENRRVLIAVLLSMVVIIAWQLLVQPVPPAGGGPEPSGEPFEAAPAEPAGQAAGPEAAAEATEERGPQPYGEPAGDEASMAAGVAQSEAELAGEPIVGEREERPVLEGKSFHAEFSSRGGELVSLHLPGYLDPDGGPVELVRSRQGEPYPFSLVDERGLPLAVDDELFAVEEGLTETGDRMIEFRYRGPAGDVTKRFTLLPSDLVEVAVEARGVGTWGMMLGPGLRNPTARDEERRFKYRGAVYLTGDEVETVDPKEVELQKVVSGAGLSWIGIEDTYFLSALIPRGGVDRAVLRAYVVQPTGDGPPVVELDTGAQAIEGEEELRRELGVAVMPEGARLEAVAYLGAKDLERLSGLGLRLNETVRMGKMLRVLARPLLGGLKWIYANVVPNYGWAIVLMTVLIKLVLLPLTHKSYVSMQKMQEVAPRIKAIRSKYQGKLRDKKGRPDIEQQRKMNEEVQKLYREEGVSPAGGCLPMLVQFPVLIAFYRLLSNAVELRDAPWVLWIHDLSLHDPIYVLPIVMGATQFLQQKLAPSAAEPMQRRMMMAMPVVFTFLFLGFPSGLVLYWLTNNVLTVIQQWVYQRLKARAAAGG